MSLYSKEDGKLHKIGGLLEQRYYPRYFDLSRTMEGDQEIYVVSDDVSEYYKVFNEKTVYQFRITETNTTETPKIRLKIGDSIIKELPLADVTLDSSNRTVEIGSLLGVYQMYTLPGLEAMCYMSTVTAGNMILGVQAHVLESGESPTVDNIGDKYQAILDFGIPKGEPGSQGKQGIPGEPGNDGRDGKDGKDTLFYNRILEGVLPNDSVLLENTNFNRTPVVNDAFSCVYNDTETNEVFYQIRKITAVQSTASTASLESSVLISRQSSGGDGPAIDDGEKAKIYGVDNVGSSDPSGLTRTDDAVGLKVTVGSFRIQSDFDSCYPWSEMKEVTDKNGNVFIKIPKFYSKITKNSDGTYKHQISGTKHSGFTTLFVDWVGNEIDYVLVGKYEGSGTSDLVESKSGQTVLVKVTIDDFRKGCAANGAGYQQFDYLIYLILQELFLIEFATTDSQSIMKGYTTSTNSAAIATGRTDRVDTPSGSESRNTDGIHAMKYRGIENLYGNVSKWVDGISFDNDSVYVCYDPTAYNGGKIDAPYVYQGKRAIAAGYVKSFGPLDNDPLIQYITNASGDSDKTYFADSSYNVGGGTLLYFGGAWNSGSGAGCWYLFGNCPTYDAYMDIGGRLCYKPL